MIARRGTDHGSGLGKVPWVVERPFAWLHNFRRLRIRYERSGVLHNAFLALGAAIICPRLLPLFPDRLQTSRTTSSAIRLNLPLRLPRRSRLLYVCVRMVGVSSKLGRVAGIFSLVALSAVLGAALPGVALLLAPALLLFAVLLLGFTPGEQLLERMRARRFACRAERPPRMLAIRGVVVVRRMVPPAASALAMRPPPAVSALIG